VDLPINSRKKTAEANCFSAEIGPKERTVAGGGITLVEYQIKDGEDGIDALWHLAGFCYSVGAVRFCGLRFGMLVDPFGIQWMFRFEYPKD